MNAKATILFTNESIRHSGKERQLAKIISGLLL